MSVFLEAFNINVKEFPRHPTSLSSAQHPLLNPTSLHELTRPSLRNLQPADQTDSDNPEKESHSYAWWRTLDTTSQYTELNSTFTFLSSYITKEGPIGGVVGFSQGGSLAAMFACWLESSIKPARTCSLLPAPPTCSNHHTSTTRARTFEIRGTLCRFPRHREILLPIL
jgi:hypothetical protein